MFLIYHQAARKGSCPWASEVKETQHCKSSRKGCRVITKHPDDLWMSQAGHCLFGFYYLYLCLHLKHKDAVFSCRFNVFIFTCFLFKEKWVNVASSCLFLSVLLLFCMYPVLYFIPFAFLIKHCTFCIPFHFTDSLAAPYFKLSLLMLRY